MPDPVDFLLSPWGWLSFAALAAAMEVLLPGVYLIWVALAAFLTAITEFALDLSPAWQFIAFALYVIVSLAAARRWNPNRLKKSDQPLLNRRGAQMIGRTAIVTKAIRGGGGRVRLGDGEWIATGPDADEGAEVRITGSDGAILQVVPEGSAGESAKNGGDAPEG